MTIAKTSWVDAFDPNTIPWRCWLMIRNLICHPLKRTAMGCCNNTQHSVSFSIKAFAKTKFDPNSSYNQSFIDDPEINKLLKELRVTTDAARHRQIAKYLWDFETSNVYGLWLGGEQGYAMVGERMHNFMTRTGKNFTGFLEYPWLSNAPRTTF